MVSISQPSPFYLVSFHFVQGLYGFFKATNTPTQKGEKQTFFSNRPTVPQASPERRIRG
jgi:hypothetical protein